jgi:TM2 domain-containing membrane protein YozV
MNAGWYPDPEIWGYMRYWDGQQWTPYRRPPIAQKSAGLAALFTFLWPGSGHMYLGLTSKGMPHFVVNAVFLALVLITFGFLAAGRDRLDRDAVHDHRQHR